jgi:hypothetical protein
MSDSGEEEVAFDPTAQPAGDADDNGSSDDDSAENNAGEDSDGSESVELTYLEHGFDFMLSLVRS